MDSKLLPDMTKCKSFSEADAVTYLNNVIDKLEQSSNSLSSVNIYDLIFRLATSYYDYYDKFIGRICEEFIRRDMTKLIYDILNNLPKPIDVNNETTELILEWLINFSEHSSEIAQKIQTSNVLQWIIDSVLNENLTNIKNDRINKIVKMHIMIISNFSRRPNNILTHRIEEIKRILIGFIKFNCNDSLGVVSVLTLSYLLDEADASLLNEGLHTIDILIKQIQLTMKTNKRSGGFTLCEMLHGLHCMSSNDNMKNEIVAKGGLPLLMKILKNNNEKEIEATLGIIENLCFDEGIKMKLIKDCKIEEIVKKFLESKCKNVSKHAEGIMWKIKDKYKLTHQKFKDIKAHFDVFISYCWANKPQILKIRNDFKKNNIRVWIDEEQMGGGSSIEAMAEGIENSQLFIVGVSSSYKKSSNCRHEAEYAFHIQKPIIPVIMELRYKATSWLGFIVGAKFYYELSERRDTKEELMKIRTYVKSNINKSIALDDETKQCQVRMNNSVKRLENSSERHETLKDWTIEDVQKWLLKSNLGHLKEPFIKVDGSLLQILLEIRSNSPDYFNKTLKSEFGMKFVDVLNFHKILNQLSS